LGGDTNSWGVYGYDGNVYYNSSPVNNIGGFSVNTTIGVAYNPSAAMLFFSKNGVWANSCNPATLANPIVAGVPVGLGVRPGLWLYDLGTSLELKTRASDLTYSIPAGYSAFDLS